MKDTMQTQDTEIKPLPPLYSRAEENMNFITHAIGSVFGLFVLIFCVVISVMRGGALCVTASAVYGSSMIALYTMSAVYHGLPPGKAKRVFRVLDHCTIYFLIAGTYTPVLLGPVRLISPAAAYSLLSVEWGVAAVAAVFTAIDLKKYAVLSMAAYLILGWGVLAILPVVIRAAGINCFILLLVGGASYTVGSVLYGLGKKRKFMHSVFHIFCLLGSLFQFLSIALYCL
ncbi:MAG: hemolysin III family protein [Clostridiales bacterium]|jgi:hemolysin III|nr:hemolysin III family protein [Clostridiales bacterium]